MLQVDAALAVEPVEAFHHVVGLAGALHQAGAGDDAGTVAADDQRGHGPEPGLLGAAEGFGLGPAAGGGGVAGAGCGGHRGDLSFAPCVNTTRTYTR
jgi:hypothetical protein